MPLEQVCNCVGKRNYRYFVGFLVTLTSFIAWVFFWSLFLFIRDAVSSSFVASLEDNPVAAIEVVVSFGFGWCLCGLSWYHCFLISQNITTNEHIKELHHAPPQETPQDEGTIVNCYRVLCAAVPPSAIDLRAPVDAQPAALSSVSVKPVSHQRGASQSNGNGARHSGYAQQQSQPKEHVIRLQPMVSDMDDSRR